MNQLDSRISSIFWLDRKTVEQVFTNILRDAAQVDEACNRRITEIKDDGWDLFLRVLEDGSIVITAVAVCSHFSPLMALPLLKFVVEH
jgi:hypothetical protein